MPRVFITKEQQQNNRLAMLIYGTMKVKRITQTTMARQLQISQQAFSKKLKNAQFTFLELVEVFEILGIPDKEILTVMKYQY